MIPTGPLVRRRTAALLAAFYLLFALLAVRIFRLQILEGGELQARAQSQWTRESRIVPRRGTIYDRNGQVLAISATAYIASVSPRQVKDAAALARTVAPVLGLEEETVKRRASDRSKGGVTLKRQLSRETAAQLREMIRAHRAAGSEALDGLYLEEDSRRYYPLGDFASQLIGITSADGVGQSGLEKSLDKYLSGRPGRVLDEIDGKGRSVADGEKEYVAAVDGSDIRLTIDAAIQLIVEQAAREAVTVNGAKAVRALVMDPGTGEILAICSKPSFDLNEPPREDVEALNELMRNRVVADAYEPGSTFKLITTASALDAGVTSEKESFYCAGSVKVEGGRIRCWGNPHGAETMAKGLQNSCNPVFVELGLRLGVERFYDYLEAFGLGKPTGVDIPGEESGILIPRASCKRVDIARIGFGQSVALTPLQLLTAACATVNGGNLMRPFVVGRIISPSGAIQEEGRPAVAGNPVSSKTSGRVAALAEDVVSYGGGKNAFLQGYHVGGKTGTAQLYVDGVVSSGTHIGSFLGFAPMQDPRIAVLVIVDEATKRPDFGSVTAAPFARQILERSLKYLCVAPDGERAAAARELSVPDLAGMGTAEALRRLKEIGFGGLISGAGKTIVSQLPAAGARMAEGSLITLYADGAEIESGERVEVPDVSALTIAEAARLLNCYGLSMDLNGSGLAVSQSPAAGEPVTPTTRVTVSFEPPGG